MSANRDDIRVRIAGDIADIRKSLQDLRKDTRATGADAKRSRGDWKGLGSTLDTIKRQVVGVIGAYVGFRAVGSLIRGVIQNTTEAERVTAQLEATVRSTGQAAGFTAEDLLAMATELQGVTNFSNEAVASLQSVLLTFTRIRGDEFAAATDAILDMSTALNQDLKSAAIQVGKALNDPIRGVSALAESGIQFTGAQRELINSLVETGDVAGAQRIILEELNTQFGGSARAARDTLGGALAALKNAFGDLLEGDGGSIDGARESIEGLITVLNDPATKQAFLEFIGFLADAARFVTQFASGLAIVLTNADAGPFGSEIKRARQELEALEVVRRNMGNSPVEFWPPGLVEDLERAQRELDELLAKQDEAFVAQGRRALGLDTRETEPVAVEPIDSRPALQRLQSDLEAASVILTAELKRLREQLDRDFEQNLVSFEDYYQRRAGLEQRAVENQLSQQRTQLELIDEEIRLLQLRGEETAEQENKRLKLLAEITVLEQERAATAGEAARQTAEAEADLAEQLAKVRDRLLEIQGNSAEVRARALEREFSDLVERLKVEGDTEGQALVESLINVETARANLAEIESEHSAALERMARAERRIELQAQTGVITEFEARRKIADLHRETAVEIERLIPLMRELAAASGDPAALARLEELQLEVEELAATAETAMKEASDAVRDAGASAFASWLSGVEKGRSAFQSFLDDVRRRIAQMIADRAFEKLFDLIGGVGKGKGGGGGSTGGVLASLFHAGGLVGQDGRLRRIDPIVFAGAPRLHSGGFPGLRPDERAAILQTGEEVLSRSDPRNRLNGGLGNVVVNVNTPDARTFVQRNRGQLQAEVASALSRSARRNG